MSRFAYSSLKLRLSVNNLWAPFSFKETAVQMEKDGQPGFKSIKKNQGGREEYSLMITKL